LERILAPPQAGRQGAAAAPRTFSLYVKKLEELNLITSTRALGIKGNVQIFRIKGG
jgi:hypothetical protein